MPRDSSAYLYQGAISACCRGKQTQTGGYVFEFDTEAAAPEVIGDEEWRDVVLDEYANR